MGVAIVIHTAHPNQSGCIIVKTIDSTKMIAAIIAMKISIPSDDQLIPVVAYNSADN